MKVELKAGKLAELTVASRAVSMADMRVLQLVVRMAVKDD